MKKNNQSLKNLNLGEDKILSRNELKKIVGGVECAPGLCYNPTIDACDWCSDGDEGGRKYCEWRCVSVPPNIQSPPVYGSIGNACITVQDCKLYKCQEGYDLFSTWCG